MESKYISQTRKRITKSGVTYLDSNKAYDCVVLFAPMFGNGEVYAINLQGEIVHQWQLPWAPGLYGYLLPNGNLFYMGKSNEKSDVDFPLWERFKGGIIAEFDKNSELIFKYEDVYQHHDARRTDNGGVIYLAVEEVNQNLAAKVQGGMIPEDYSGKMWSDVLIEIDKNNNRIWEWHSTEHLDIDKHKITFNDPRDEWSHGNTVVPIENDKVLVSFRNISTVALINKKTGKFIWEIGPEIIAQQHDPHILSNGNVLIFDNGVHRFDEPMPYSRIIEIDPISKDIIWEYSDKPKFNFFSPYISGVLKLPNDNVMITEGNFGRIFQVDINGNIVWEYISPYYEEDHLGVESNGIFRVSAYNNNFIEKIL